MSLKVPTASQLTLLNKLLAAYGNSLVMGLYQSAHPPALGDTASTYIAIEANFSGYARQNIANWAAAATVSAHASSTATALTWTNSTGAVGNQIYGYFVLDSSGNLLWAEQDTYAPVGMMAQGDSYSVTPAFTDTTEF